MKAYLKYFFALLMFGLNGVVASYISLSSYEIVFMRTLIGSLVLLLIFILSGRKISFQQNKQELLFLVISGAALGASWMFLYEAYQQIGVGIASLAYYCGPVIVMVLSLLLFHEKLTRAKGFGFFIVILGLLLVNFQAFDDAKGGWGLFCGGMSAVMYAVIVFANKKAARITGLENSMVQLLMGFLTVAVFVGFKQGLYIPIAGGDWVPILILGLCNTGFGCYLYFSSINCLPVQTIAICGYLEPLAAVVFSVLFLEETLLPVQLLGAACIIGGAILGEVLKTKA